MKMPPMTTANTGKVRETTTAAQRLAFMVGVAKMRGAPFVQDAAPCEILDHRPTQPAK